jgi:hypothetical protein
LTAEPSGLPGGGESTHVAGDGDCVLWLITNEPQLAFEHLEPPMAENAVIGPVHYPAAEIAHQLQRVGERLKGQKAAGPALVFSSAEQARSRNVLPTLTLARLAGPWARRSPPASARPQA